MVEIGTSYYHAEVFEGDVPPTHEVGVRKAFERIERNDGVRLGPVERKADMEPGFLAGRPEATAARVYVSEVVEGRELEHG